MTKLFIPTKLRVGFQNREGTYTGKLAYVIYYDEKDKIRKEASWKSWCHSSIPALEIENKPHSGYVFNKGIRRYSDWGSGRSVIRVYDPRDFEFEITVDNLIGILMHSDVSKRDIVEECVFAWAGSELVLLPVNSEEYRESVKYTEAQSKKVSAKELIKGAVYTKKKSDEQLTYIGHYPYNEIQYLLRTTDKGKRHVFFDGKNYVIPSVGTLSECISDECVDNYAELVDNYLNSNHTQKYKNFEVSMGPLKTAQYDYRYYKKISDNEVFSVRFGDYYNHKFEINRTNFEYYSYDNENLFTRIDGVLYLTHQRHSYYGNGTYKEKISDINRLVSISKEIKEIVDAFNTLRGGNNFIDYNSAHDMLKSLGYGNKIDVITERDSKYEYTGIY